MRRKKSRRPAADWACHRECGWEGLHLGDNNNEDDDEEGDEEEDDDNDDSGSCHLMAVCL